MKELHGFLGWMIACIAGISLSTISTILSIVCSIVGIVYTCIMLHQWWRKRKRLKRIRKANR